MESLIIILTSITYVYKARQILEKNRIKTEIVRLRVTYERRGCGYGLAVPGAQERRALGLIRDAGIRIVEVIDNSGR